MGVAIFFAVIVAVIAIAAQSQTGGMFSGTDGKSGVKPMSRAKREAIKFAKQEKREKRLNKRMDKAVERERKLQEFENAINGRSVGDSNNSAQTPTPRSHLNDALTRGFGRS